MDNERTNPGSSDDIIGSPDPEGAARAAVDTYLKKGDPSTTPAPAPRFGRPMTPDEARDFRARNPQIYEPRLAAEEPTEPEPLEPATEQEPAAGGYVLEAPGDVPTHVAMKWDETLTSFSEAASASGVSEPIAQGLVASFIDADAALGGYGQGENSYTLEDARSTLQSFWGREAYDVNMKKVAKAVNSAGDRFKQWLDDSGMGNSPSVCIALSMADDLKLTKPQAQAELNKLISDQKSDYFSRDPWRSKPAVARVQLLSRIANAEDAPSKARTTNVVASVRADEAQIERRAAADAQAKELLQQMRNGNATQRAAAEKKWIELTARISR
ncbi:MAG: hypothetical protein E6K73_14510 [Candidatus Eisenbacteria bacterium]|uniref:Uncharacterized protein n=1 Tax=Eiseniibacteriota bacterium TaxID=2212470 RepID=A0A538S691_UNCEI|nr:MAG: hypothetical protein DME04_26515 [Candidatus Rokubacteria bacterium]TMQ46885.1 MAG: hypothetical protein E6K73_14510 [Candidatus Eisenbacteria bacterium]